MNIGDFVNEDFDEETVKSPKDTRTIEFRRIAYIKELVENRGLDRAEVEKVFSPSLDPDTVYDWYNNTVAELREDQRVRTEDIPSKALRETFFKLHPEEDPRILSIDEVSGHPSYVISLAELPKREDEMLQPRDNYRTNPHLSSHKPFAYAAQRHIDRFELRYGGRASLVHLFENKQ